MRYTGIIHAHSTHSYDGKLSLEALKQLCVANGLSFACMTEHTDRMTAPEAAAFVAACRTLSDDSFVFVPGFEVPYKKAHVLHIGAEAFVCSEAKTDAHLAAWRRQAASVILAHPVRNAFIVDEALLQSIDGVEVWNQQYDGKSVPRTKSVALLEKLRQHKKLYAMAGIDLHRAEHLGSPYTVLELDALTERAILAALQEGRYSCQNQQYTITANGDWQPTFAMKLESLLACAIISLGKTINKTLARLGIRLPKRLVRAIRARV